MPIISVPDDTYLRLAARAKTLGTTVDALAAPVLDQLAQDDGTANGHPGPSQLPLTGEAWRRAFDALNRDIRARADRYPPGHVLDDSREAMYSDREDAQR